MKDFVYGAAAGSLSAFWLIILPFALALNGYADVAAGVWATAMVGVGVWLSAKGMARLKRFENLSDNALETAYRYRNAGLALGLTGSGMLVFSWQKFPARFITTASGMSGM